MQAHPLTTTNPDAFPRPLARAGRVDALENSEQAGVLAFLERRPIYTTYLAGLVRDNGLESELNRGTFYGYRNLLGELEGVALIGHATLLETISNEALRAFAKTAQSCNAVHLIMCEENHIDNFWSYYAAEGQQMRRACRELLFELRWPVEVSQVSNLRLATLDDLSLLMPVHAQMALDESGVDPMQQDAAGFYERYARRIAQGRTWVLTENGQLQFKAEVVAETPSTSYIEGVWVNPSARRQGYGRRCMSQLARMLLWRTKSICLFVNDENEEAQRFYKQAGYHLRAVYDTIFLK
ncbi:MAG TPA: GNAT family N-acetyltransferase [Pyrinomonadaceae bacterium]|jgi:ribosomal protein S18 acetylase RimI-like enzyme